MKRFMTRSLTSVLSPVVAGSLLLTACANNHAQKDATAGAIIGGGGGFVLCKLTGGSDSHCAKFAAVTAVAGGVIGWQHGKEKDLQEARAFSDSLNKKGIPAYTETAYARQTDASGQTATVNSVKRVGFPIRQTISAKDTDMVTAIREVGRRAAIASKTEPYQVVAVVPASNRLQVSQWIQEGISQAGSNGKAPAVLVVDAKSLKEAGIYYAPTNDKQFI